MIDYSVLVIGCKKHEQIAKRYFDLAQKYWNTSLKKTFFCTDEVSDFQSSFPCQVVVDSSGNYGNRIKCGLDNVDSDYVVLLLDDYYLTSLVDDNSIVNLILFLSKWNYAYCKLIGMPKCFKRNRYYKGTYHIRKKTHYGVSLQPSIWKKEDLIIALSNSQGSNAWEVEASFSIFQSKEYERCLTYNKNFLHYKNGVLRGQLFPYTNGILAKNNLKPLHLKKISLFEFFVFSAKQSLAMHLPSFVRKIGKKIGKLMKKTYYSND